MLRAGSRLGPYEITAPIGAGGMGEVYRARDTRLGRDIAIKVLSVQFAADPERLRRFEHEARAVAALDHPNILAIHDVGTHEGSPFIVIELLEGETLRERLESEGVTVRKAVDIGIQIAQALAAAHGKGIVHRDLKPSNVFLTTDGQVKILDFGIAKLTHSEPAPGASTEASISSTDTGALMGTVGYMSPEQVRGQPTDHRTDIFAFGCVLHEMLSGEPPFRGDTTSDVMAAILKDDPAPLPARVPPALEEIVSRCLEKRREDRFSSAHDLGLALRAFCGSADTPATAAVLPRGGLLKRFRWLLAAGVLAVIAAAVVVGLRARRTPPAVAPATTKVQLPPVQLTFSPGYDGDPSFSRDGQAIAYTSERDGKLDIFIRRLDDASEMRVTHDGGNIDPAFSPDGRWIAFHSRSRGGLWLVSSLGGEPRQLTESGSQPAWSPDGRQIAFRSEGTWAIGPEAWPGTHGAVLAVVDVKSGQVHTITTTLRPPAGHGSPAWMPDGRAVVFAAGDFDRQGIYLVTVDGGAVETLVESPSESWRDPVPLPDGSAVLAIRSTGSDSIQRLSLAANRRTPAALVPLMPRSPSGLAVSPDGTRLAFAETSVEGRAETVPVDNRGHRNGSPRTVVQQPNLRLIHPNFSPDGHWLVCGRLHPGSLIDSLLVEMATGKVRELVGVRLAESGGRRGYWWASPTEVVLGGLQVDLVSGRRREAGELPGYVRMAQRYHPLSNSLALSPDGSRLLFAAPVGRAQELFVWRVGGEDAVQVTRLGRIADYPAWSRDGTRIVAQVADVGVPAHELWVMGADGTNPRRLPTGPGRSWAGSFSPSGALVTYAALRGSRWDIAVAGPNVPEHLLGLGISEAAYVRWPMWSPLGHEIAYERTAVKGDVWTLPLTAER